MLKKIFSKEAAVGGWKMVWPIIAVSFFFQLVIKLVKLFF